MSLKIEVKDIAGKPTGSVDLPAAIFDVQANVPLIHQVVVAQLAAARAGTHKTKNRGEVSGGGKKPFKQKGTAGVMKRHGFSGIGASHGVDKKHRMSGSIGNRTTPGRVFKGKRMMGRMGIDTVTTQNLLVHSVDPVNNTILIRGATPGAIGATIFIRSAAKKAAAETVNTKVGA